MPDIGMLGKFLDGASVDAAVFGLRPDYRALLLAVGGLVPGPGDEASEALLQAAEAAAREALRQQPGEERCRHGAVRHRGRRCRVDRVPGSR
jgi:hypothetical protein